MSHYTPTSGVKPMSIGGRVIRERERLQGMTADERAWRAQWLKDQILTDREGPKVQTWHNPCRNIIRRFYQKPLDVLVWKPLTPVIGYGPAWGARYIVGKIIIFTLALYGVNYYLKYDAHDWQRKGGWMVFQSRQATVPGDPGYPKLSERSKPQEYADRGFSKSPI